MRDMKIGLIGIGAIGGFLAKNLKNELIWVCDIDERFCRTRMKELGIPARVKYVSKPEEGAYVDLVIEAASQKAVPLMLPVVSQSNILIMSVGALRDDRLLKKLREAAKKSNHTIYIPSGAIGGLDAVKSAAPAGIVSVVLETRKPPKTLGRADEKETVVFEGSAKEACEKFPQSVNVAATLAISGIGFEKTKVRVVSDPSVSQNVHTITLKGNAGEFKFVVENVPSEENPKTSALAMLAALRAVREIEGTELRIL